MRMLFQPPRHKRSVISECQVVLFLSKLAAECRKPGGETQISLMDLRSTGNFLGSQVSEEISHDVYHTLDIPIVRTDILSSYVRAEFLVAMRSTVQDKTDFPFLFPLPIFFRAEKHSQLQRHIKTR